MAGMTREELESLGWTDEKLEAECRKTIGYAPEIAGKPDTKAIRIVRRSWFIQLEAHQQPSRVLRVDQPMGQFADVRDKKP